MYDLVYCYPNSDVLMNNFNIRDQRVLSRIEQRFTAFRLLELADKTEFGDFDIKHFCDIHQYIFQDIYAWAGDFRTVDIAKGNLFCKAEFLNTEAERVFQEILLRRDFAGSKTEDAAKILAYVLSELNALHPFREGNGRTQREFIRQLAFVNGYHIDYTLISQEEMIAASRASFLCEYGPMEELMQRCIKVIAKFLL